MSETANVTDRYIIVPTELPPRPVRQEPKVRLFIVFILVIYLVGVGVALAPAIGAKWSTATASDLAASVMQELPHALAWPATTYRSLRDQTTGPPQPPKD
jgi:hypothetical protein